MKLLLVHDGYEIWGTGEYDSPVYVHGYFDATYGKGILECDSIEDAKETIDAIGGRDD